MCGRLTNRRSYQIRECWTTSVAEPSGLNSERRPVALKAERRYDY